METKWLWLYTNLITGEEYQCVAYFIVGTNLSHFHLLTHIALRWFIARGFGVNLVVHYIHYPVHVCITPANALNNCSEIHPHILIKAQISLWLTEPPILKLISGWMDDDDVDGAVLRRRGILKLSIVPRGLYQWLYIKPRKYNLLYLILCRPFSKHDCK